MRVVNLEVGEAATAGIMQVNVTLSPHTTYRLWYQGCRGKTHNDQRPSDKDQRPSDNDQRPSHNDQRPSHKDQRLSDSSLLHPSLQHQQETRATQGESGGAGGLESKDPHLKSRDPDRLQSKHSSRHSLESKHSSDGLESKHSSHSFRACPFVDYVGHLGHVRGDGDTVQGGPGQQRQQVQQAHQLLLWQCKQGLKVHDNAPPIGDELPCQDLEYVQGHTNSHRFSKMLRFNSTWSASGGYRLGIMFSGAQSGDTFFLQRLCWGQEGLLGQSPVSWQCGYGEERDLEILRVAPPRGNTHDRER